MGKKTKKSVYKKYNEETIRRLDAKKTSQNSNKNSNKTQLEESTSENLVEDTSKSSSKASDAVNMSSEDSSEPVLSAPEVVHLNQENWDTNDTSVRYNDDQQDGDKMNVWHTVDNRKEFSESFDSGNNYNVNAVEFVPGQQNKVEKHIQHQSEFSKYTHHTPDGYQHSSRKQKDYVPQRKQENNYQESTPSYSRYGNQRNARPQGNTGGYTTRSFSNSNRSHRHNEDGGGKFVDQTRDQNWGKYKGPVREKSVNRKLEYEGNSGKRTATSHTPKGSDEYQGGDRTSIQKSDSSNKAIVDREEITSWSAEVESDIQNQNQDADDAAWNCSNVEPYQEKKEDAWHKRKPWEQKYNQSQDADDAAWNCSNAEPYQEKKEDAWHKRKSWEQKSKPAHGQDEMKNIDNWREQNSSNRLPKKTPDSRIERRSRDLFDTSFEKKDHEYAEFRNKRKGTKSNDSRKIIEEERDLFDMPKEYSLAHCVAEDLRMGSGIAVQFKRDFGYVEELLNQREKQGGLAVLYLNNRYIYYLVTKRVSTGKPTYDTFWSSLKKMRDHIRDNKVQKLAIPKIGCGLDRLEWSYVKEMIEFLFRDVDVEIIVCSLIQIEDDTPKKDFKSLRVVYADYSISKIDSYTIILYFSTEDGHVSKDMLELDKKFNFVNKFKNTRKQRGVAIRHDDRNNNYILYGCIVRKTKDDFFDFSSFKNCLSEINKNNNKDKYEYVGIPIVNDDQDDLLDEKILTIMKHTLRKVDIYVCRDYVHPDKVKEEK